MQPTGSLADSTLAIIGPKRDALLFWGAPLAAFVLVQIWLHGCDKLAPATVSGPMVSAIFAFISVLTWAHLIAVAPRAYLNGQVFAAYRLRLIAAPVLLTALLLLSPTALIVAGVVAVFWDVHHSAMQNFGFTRIYDMKAGNPAQTLRATDLRLNWALYVGPLAAGASLAVHTNYFFRFEGTVLQPLISMPGVLDAEHQGIRLAAVALYGLVIAWAVLDYSRAMRAGYRLPIYKLATLVSTGVVSILAWGFSPPLVALAAINLYHAVQYFALVWVKEGESIAAKLGGINKLSAMLIFLVTSMLFGLAYAAAMGGTITLFLAPFVACSLLHFWYDGFVWSVRRHEV